MVAVDTREIFSMVAKLSEIHRAALPNAIRSTLNDLAFDVKKNQLLPSLKSTSMDIRNPAMFKKYSGVEKATGWDINAMKSESGMIPSGDASRTIERLKQQDIGGDLKGRNLKPGVSARSGNTNKGKVKKSAYMQNIIIVANIPFGDKKGLIRAVTGSGPERGGKGSGFAVLYGNTLFEIKGYKRLRKMNTIKLHLDKLYTYQPDRTEHIKPQYFMKTAAMNSGAKMREMFNINADKQMAKFANR